VIRKADGYFNPAGDILDAGRSPGTDVLAAASQNGAAQ
jgi:hypothetical protein